MTAPSPVRFTRDTLEIAVALALHAALDERASIHVGLLADRGLATQHGDFPAVIRFTVEDAARIAADTALRIEKEANG